MSRLPYIHIIIYVYIYIYVICICNDKVPGGGFYRSLGNWRWGLPD